MIISHLKSNLEELSLSYTKVTVKQLIELRCMSKLKYLNCLHLKSDEIKSLKRNLPQVSVNEGIKIASMLSFRPQERIWDIEVKQLQYGPSIVLQPKTPGISGSSFPTQQDFEIGRSSEMMTSTNRSPTFTDYFSVLKKFLQDWNGK